MVNRGRLVWSRSQEAVAAFGNPKYFTDRYISSNKPGVMIKLPNFDVLFEVGSSVEEFSCAFVAFKLRAVCV